MIDVFIYNKQLATLREDFERECTNWQKLVTRRAEELGEWKVQKDKFQREKERMTQEIKDLANALEAQKKEVRIALTCTYFIRSLLIRSACKSA